MGINDQNERRHAADARRQSDMLQRPTSTSTPRPDSKPPENEATEAARVAGNLTRKTSLDFSGRMKHQ